ncbi:MULTISPECIES: sugar ABC transporter permease [Agromyces]|uniref:carbohydrate ABC transporter permease n=1 Tax=Agromyces TaxID=33877 RepID=UPI001E33175F|nr:MULTISPECIES: sugar ABC transporter permease [Agromyces]MCD1570465.1 sugar ABC transporter permease [Agromyces mediolanus]GLU88816.1 sugar ABC transporter permease [Agromyces sp. NBRC 114283]
MSATSMTTAPRRRGNTGIALTRRTGMVFVLPALILFGVFIAYPLLTALSYSFFGWTGIVRGDFVGVENYLTLFTKLPYSEDIPNAFVHNVLLFVGAMLFQNTVGLGLATLLHRVRRFKRFFQTMYTLPYLVSPLVIGYLWSLMLSPLFGPVNAVLRTIGLGEIAQPWLGNPQTAIWVVVFVTAWQWIGFPVLLYGAALGGIPEEIEEAASLDGASSWQRFRSITLPMLVPAIGTVSVLTFIGAMEAFPIPYALGGSQGNPAGATDVLSLLFYRTAFESGSSNAIGTSSAIATLLFLFIFGISMLITWLMRRAERKLF